MFSIQHDVATGADSPRDYPIYIRGTSQALTRNFRYIAATKLRTACARQFYARRLYLARFGAAKRVNQLLIYANLLVLAFSFSLTFVCKIIQLGL